MTMNERVFVIERPKPGLDISKAAEYGEIVHIFHEGDGRCSVFDSDKFCQRIIERLQELRFDPDRDSICVVGSMILVVLLVVAAQAEWCHTTFLFYSASESRYVKRRLDACELRSGL
jgi:hypothetical protein